MTCNEIREQLGAYIDGELPPSAQTAVAEHVPCCKVCSDELDSLRRLCGCLAPAARSSPPAALWSAIENRLNDQHAAPRWRVTPFRAGRLIGIAACLVVAVGAGYLVSQRGFDVATPAQAATVDFRVLLDNLAVDPRGAFDHFLKRYGAEPTTVSQAKTYAAKLNYEIPETLPGGFQLEATYKLRFGDSPGVAAQYSRNGEFLAALFHPPVLKEHFGTHKDYDCVVGEHRGHTVAVGEWRLVHLTDATTCHCVLSRLDPITELPAIMAAVAPELLTDSTDARHEHNDKRP